MPYGMNDEEMRAAYVKWQRTKLDDLLTDTVKEGVQAHLVKIGMSAEGAENLRVKALGKNINDGIKIGLPEGLPEKDYVALHIFLGALEKKPVGTKVRFTVSMPDAKLKNNATLVSDDAEHLVAGINAALDPAYRISIDSVWKMRMRVGVDDGAPLDAIDFMIWRPEKPAAAPASASEKASVEELTPFQLMVMKKTLDGWTGRACPVAVRLPRKSVVALVARQLQEELVARTADSLPEQDKVAIKNIVSKNFEVRPVDDFGTYRVQVGMTRAGIDVAYGNDHQAAATLITRAAELQARQLGDAFDRAGSAETGTFRREYLPGDTSTFTVGAHSLEDLERGVNTQLRSELKINVEQFRTR